MDGYKAAADKPRQREIARRIQLLVEHGVPWLLVCGVGIAVMLLRKTGKERNSTRRDKSTAWYRRTLIDGGKCPIKPCEPPVPVLGVKQLLVMTLHARRPSTQSAMRVEIEQYMYWAVSCRRSTTQDLCLLPVTCFIRAQGLSAVAPPVAASQKANKACRSSAGQRHHALAAKSGGASGGASP